MVDLLGRKMQNEQDWNWYAVVVDGGMKSVDGGMMMLMSNDEVPRESWNDDRKF